MRRLTTAYGIFSALALTYWLVDLIVDGFEWPAVAGALSMACTLALSVLFARDLARREQHERPC
jgi:apolipoprotein N-acyltransferase